MGACCRAVRHMLDPGGGIDLWGSVMGPCDWIGVMGLIHGGMRHWLDRGEWDCFMGAHDTGWIGRWDWFMGGCRGSTRHWLDRRNGIDSWRCATLAGAGRWDWFMGACHGGTWHWLDRGDGIDWWGCAMGICDTGTGWWHWFMGMRYGGAQLDQGDGLLCGGTPWGCHTGWIWVMGLICGGGPWGCHTGWIWVMGLICGGGPWGHATLARSGRWDWFMGECPMTKYYMVVEFKITIPYVSSYLALRVPQVLRVCLVKGLVDANGWVVAWGVGIRQWDDGAVSLTY